MADRHSPPHNKSFLFFGKFWKADAAGFEPATSRLTVVRSTELSYAPIERFRNKKIRHARSDVALFPERSPTFTVWEKRCWKKPDLNFTSRQTSKRNDKICTCTSSAWDVDQGIMALRSRCFSRGILPSRDYSKVDCHYC